MADGARPDAIASGVASGDLPALASLRDDGGLYTVTTCAPSVTGPAYTPFLLGRYPAPIGLPGLRWYDRTRQTCRLPGNSRSYVGFEMRHVDADLDAANPTMYELVPSSLGALSVITRGLPARRRIGYAPQAKFRTALTHFRGDVPGWLDIDRGVARELCTRISRDRPDFVFAALTGTDKISHAAGHDSPLLVESLKIVDDLVGELRSNLEEARTWEQTRLWVVSDHGHVQLKDHEDLVRVLSDWGYRVRAHPWVYTSRGDVAVMVSGNALAHLYFDLETRERRWWRGLALRWEAAVQQLLTRDSVDLVLLPHSASSVEIRARGGRGSAMLEAYGGRYAYRPRSGDPLGIGELPVLDTEEAYDVTIDSDYPDALVQIAALCTAARSGDVILSATRDWDFRARHEPIPHVSSHGALHRDHMLVPLMLNRPPRVTPRRTVDVFPSALDALGLARPPVLDGQSFL
ncbi:MAG TPA: alkaline phosphatase family protein [Gemmatimonadaceae bacterium]|nr:alkaline phosphatase family protein [Gemmatimonadaceae bacterium]